MPNSNVLSAPIGLVVAALLAQLDAVAATAGDLEVAATYDGGYGTTNVTGAAIAPHPYAKGAVLMVNTIGPTTDTVTVAELRDMLRSADMNDITDAFLSYDGGFGTAIIRGVRVTDHPIYSGRSALVLEAS